MIRLAIASVLVAACLAQQTLMEHCCSKDDRTQVANEWNAIWNSPDSSKVKIIVGRAIFDRFLLEDPEAKGLFERVNVDNPDSGEFNAHMLRVLTGVDLLVNLLASPSALNEEVNHLRSQHAIREGVTLARMQKFLGIMIDELPYILPTFNKDAWGSCFSRFFETIADY